MNKFQLNKLAAANVHTEAEDVMHFDFLGRIVAIESTAGNETRYKLASFDETSFWFKESELKAACHYRVKNAQVEVGESASVYTLDHPHLGEEFVWTTEVLAKNGLGFFITKNTVYIPNEVHLKIGFAETTIKSPLLAQA